MATFNLKVPENGLKSPTDYSKGAELNMLKDIDNRYGKFFSFAESTSRIPKDILMAFCAIESAGNPLAGGSNSVTQGLMQWNRTFMKSVLENEFKQGRLNPLEKAKLAEYGIKFDAKGKTREITQSDQIKPELNILLGSILLGQLADEKWAAEGGVLRLDRIIAVYNAGAFGETGKKARLGKHATPALLASEVNPITRSYINKMLGSNGALQVFTSALV
jgi:hypothetical protein